MSLFNQTTRRTFVKGAGCAAVVAGVGVSVMAKGGFDPASFVKKADRLGFVQTAIVQNGEPIGLYTAEPDEPNQRNNQAYMKLRVYQRSFPNSFDAITQHLVNVGRFHGTIGGAI